MGMDNNSIDTNTYALLKKGLDVSALRSKVSANNVANINTKGYKSYYVSFEDTLNDSINNLDNLEMKTSDDRHIKDNVQSYGEESVKQDTTTSMNQDGNNVDIENEMVNQAANSLEYNALINQINNRFASSRLVINGGK